MGTKKSRGTRPLHATISQLEPCSRGCVRHNRIHVLKCVGQVDRPKTAKCREEVQSMGVLPSPVQKDLGWGYANKVIKFLSILVIATS